MIDTLDDFLVYIPTATGSKWEALETYVSLAKEHFKTNVFGTELYGKIETSPDMLNKQMSLAIACMAYRDSIPFNDLIQTSNGFAVVNNANQSPASRERVDKLLLWCQRTEDNATDAVIQHILSDSDLCSSWAKCEAFPQLTDTLFLTGTELRVFAGKPEAIRTDLFKLRPTILGFQADFFAKHISGEYLTELIEKRRTNTLIPIDKQMLQLLKPVLGILIQSDEKLAYSMIENVINVLVTGIGNYPAYAGSAAYRLKLAPKYENKKDHTTYFFG